jgi:hypothetical protein
MTRDGAEREVNPIDQAVGAICVRHDDTQSDWALRLLRQEADGEGVKGIRVSVTRELPARDEWEAPIKWRTPAIHDVPSMVEYGRKYGDAAKSIVFVNDTGAVMVLDDVKPRGEREIATLTFNYAPDYLAWKRVLSEPCTHKTLLRHLLSFTHNLVEPDILASMRRLRATATVKHDSDIKELDQEVGVVMITSGGEDLAKFPKTFEIKIPILDDDSAEESSWEALTIRLEPVLPEQPNHPVTFLLICPNLGATVRARIGEEIEHMRSGLKDWLIVRGTHREAPRLLGDATAKPCPR